MSLFVDTWGWLTVEDRSDPNHHSAVAQYELAVRLGPIFTSDYVLDETITRLFRRRPFAEAQRFVEGLLRSPRIKVVPVTEARFTAGLRLRFRLADKPDISFTDLTSMVIMQEHRLRDVLTGDRHFRQAGLGFRLLPG